MDYRVIIKPMLERKNVIEHSLNVSEEAVKLAKKYGADERESGHLQGFCTIF